MVMKKNIRYEKKNQCMVKNMWESNVQRLSLTN